MRNYRYIFFILAGLFVLAVCSPARADYIPPINIYDCADDGGIENIPPGGGNNGHGFQPNDGNYTIVVVTCVQQTVYWAVYTLMQNMTAYMAPILYGMVVLMIMVFAMRILSGDEELSGKTISLIFRLGIVVMFANNMGNGQYVYTMFDVMGELCGLMNCNFDALWPTIDTFLGQLLGFSKAANGQPQLTVMQGFLGIVGVAAASGIGGSLLFVTGLMALADVVFFVLRVVMIYLNSYVTIGFLLIISPLVIPLALFNYTERFVKKWLDILIANMLTPALLCAFLSLFIGIFGTLITNVFLALFPANIVNQPNFQPDMTAFLQNNLPAYAQMFPTDPNLTKQESRASAGAGGDDPKKVAPPIQSFISPLLAMAATKTNNNAGFNAGPNDAAIKGKLAYAFISLFIFSSLMVSMIGKIPEIASSIANAVSGVRWGPAPYEREIKSKIQSMRK